MSFFSSVFGSASGDRPDFWKIIESQQDLENAIQNSFERKVVIFKHSTRCFISKSVLKRFEKEVENSEKNVDFYFLDLLKFRNISNKIADDFDIRHESPQMVVLENGKAVKSASHEQIYLDLV